MTRRRAVLAGASAAALVGAALVTGGVVLATQDRSVHVRSPAAPVVRTPGPAPAGRTASGSAPAAPRRTSVVVLVEENHEYARIIGSPSAPFLTALATHGTRLSAYYGIRHPSLPNYLAMIGGDTFGVHSDCTRCRVRATDLVHQLEAAHISWAGYFQGLPAPCSDVASAGAYAKKHNPFMYFDDIRTDPARCRHVVPIDDFGRDAAAGRLPRFAFVVPDLDHDMHDGSVATGDRWAQALYGQLSAAPTWGAGSRLVVTFDEGSSDAGCCRPPAAGGHVVTIVAGPGAPAGVVDATPYDHYSLLASIESAFGLSRLGYAAAAGVTTIPALASS